MQSFDPYGGAKLWHLALILVLAVVGAIFVIASIVGFIIKHIKII